MNRKYIRITLFSLLISAFATLACGFDGCGGVRATHDAEQSALQHAGDGRYTDL